jgi:hypothetical protein
MCVIAEDTGVQNIDHVHLKVVTCASISPSRHRLLRSCVMHTLRSLQD